MYSLHYHFESYSSCIYLLFCYLKFCFKIKVIGVTLVKYHEVLADTGKYVRLKHKFFTIHGLYITVVPTIQSQIRQNFIFIFWLLKKVSVILNLYILNFFLSSFIIFISTPKLVGFFCFCCPLILPVVVTEHYLSFVFNVKFCSMMVLKSPNLVSQFLEYI